MKEMDFAMYPIIFSLRHQAFALIALALLTSPLRAETKELFLAHLGTPGSIYDISVNEFARRANAKLPADYRVVPAGNSRFGGDVAVLEKLKTGEVAFGLPSSAMSSISTKFNVFELPFLIRNREQVRKLGNTLLEPVFQPEAKKAGFRILALWENGFRQITNNKRPINRPEDMKGLRIRVPSTGSWRDKVFRALGADPVAVDFGNVYEGLRAGTIDGQENPLSLISATEFHKVQRYLSLSDHLYTPAYLIVSEQQFAKLPPGVQEILSQTAQDLRSWIFDRAIKLESDLVDQMGEHMQINQIDLHAFRRASRPIYGEFARTVPGGAKLIETINELAQNTSSQTDVQ